MSERGILARLDALEAEVATLRQAEARRQAHDRAERAARIRGVLLRREVGKKLDTEEMGRLRGWLRAHPEKVQRADGRRRTVERWRDGEGNAARRVKLEVVWEHDFGLALWELDEVLSGEVAEEDAA